YHLSMDLTDPTFSNPEGGLQWEEITGPAGTVVDRWRLNQVTPGGTLQDLVATSYYRDNSCFDDGTGTNPGPKLHLRSADEPPNVGEEYGRNPVEEPLEAVITELV